jgi:hypothetical protein
MKNLPEEVVVQALPDVPIRASQSNFFQLIYQQWREKLSISLGRM